MENVYDKYQVVIGLEVHAQLQTKSKAYASDKNEYGALPNTQISPITLGHPGTLPKFNKAAVEHAIKMGLACGCDITREMHFARKNYFYPDLPKGYQITQDTTPICTNGQVVIKDENGNEKEIKLTRIHLEEDAGKSIHDIDPFDTLVDLNRAGVPLIEIVSEPDLRSSTEAYNYLTEIRKLVRYLDVCDGNMEEGSLRCDANISVMLKGASKFGERCEVKNMNSIRNVQRAIEHEIVRQIDIIEAGGEIKMETRSFIATDGSTVGMRSKEQAHDYRYFPEPDLAPLSIKTEDIEEIRLKLPPLPQALFKKYVTELGLSEYDAGVLTDEKGIALFFEDVISNTKNAKAAANWVMGTVKSYLNQNALSIEQFDLSPKKVADIIQLVDDNKVSNSVATQKIFPLLVKDSSKSPLEIAEAENLIQESDQGAIEDIVKQAIAKFPDKVKEYNAGKKGLAGLFMGEVMKLSKGKADPKLANQLVRTMLEAEG